MKAREAVDWILETLNRDSLQRLCYLREEKRGGTNADRRGRLESSYGSDVDALLSDLRNAELQAVAQDWADEVDFALHHVSRGRAAELEALVRLLLVDDWTPRGDDEVPIPGAPFLAGPGLQTDEVADGSHRLLKGQEVADERLSWIDDAFSESDVAEPTSDDAVSPLALPEFEEIDPSTAPGPEHRPDAQLAGFQVEAVAALDAHFRHNDAGLLCLPTGGGKTRTSLEWLLTRFVGRGQRVLWVTHRVGLLDQVHEELRGLAWILRGKVPRLTISRFQGLHSRADGDVILASTATLVSRRPTLRNLAEAGPVGVVCFDEAHRAVATETWKALERLRGTPRIPLLGLTATPFRRTESGTARLAQAFGSEPVYQRPFKELVKSGFLARPCFVRHRLQTTEALTLSPEELSRARRDGEVPPSVLGSLARNERRTREIVSHWREHAAEYGKTIAFACDISHAERLASHFRKSGVAAAALHSEQDTGTRCALLERFRNDGLQVLVNVGILTEGANVPSTRTVLMARPTLSPVLYMQMIGRGARGPLTHPGKTTFNVVDCVDNFGRHGLELAGRVVARALDADLHDEIASPPQAVSPERRERGEQAAAIAATSMIVRGFDPTQCSFWGVVEWQNASGIERAVAVFVETVQAVEEAVQSVGRALETGDWAAALRFTTSLDEMGAVRAADWNEVVADARETGKAPTLARIPEIEATAVNEPLTTALAELTRRAEDQPVRIVGSLCREAWAGDEALRTAFHHPSALVQEVLKLILDRSPEVSEPEATATTDDLARAYLALGLHIAEADGRSDPSELQVLSRSLPRVFPDASVPSVARVASTSVRPVVAANLLRDNLDWHQRLVVVDYLFRIATADRELVPQEERALREIGGALGVPAEDVDERCRWASAKATVTTPGLEGYLTCRGCAATWRDDGSTFFCGHCGAKLRSLLGADAADTLPG